MTTARVTQIAVEAVSAGAPAARLTQIAAEVISVGTPRARVSQLVVEVVSTVAESGGGGAPGGPTVYANAGFVGTFF